MAPSEEETDMDVLLNKLGLNYKGADRAKGWEHLISKGSQQQVFVTWSFCVDVQSTAGRTGYISSQFIKDMKKAMYHEFKTKEELVCHILNIKKYLKESHIQAQKLVQVMLDNVEKLCYTISGQKLIMSRGGMSRREGTMSSPKGNGSLKKEIQSYSLYEVVMHYLRMTKQQDDESVLVIKDSHWSIF